MSETQSDALKPWKDSLVTMRKELDTELRQMSETKTQEQETPALKATIAICDLANNECQELFGHGYQIGHITVLPIISNAVKEETATLTRERDEMLTAIRAMNAAGMIPQLSSFPVKTKTAQGEATRLVRKILKEIK